MLNAPLLNAAVDAFKIPDLRRKLLFTLGMLVAFRFIAHIPVPGADVDALQHVFETNQLAGFFDLFSGGALSSLSIAALGVYPYITAQIIMQIMQPAIPKLQEIAKEGESGRQKINQWTHWLTVPLALFQAYGTPNLINFSSGGNTPIIKNFGFDADPLGTLAIIISMTAGTMLLVWMGELITQYGVGQGVSIIIFGGIMARLPFQVFQGFAAWRGLRPLIMFGVAGDRDRRGDHLHLRRPATYSGPDLQADSRQRVYGGGTTHIPLKVNSAGMIPLIFASSMLILPWTISSYFVNSDNQIVSTIATTIYNTFNAGTSFGLLVAVLHHGRRVHLLLRAGDLPAAKHRREPAASKRLYSGHPAWPADASVSVAGADSHHRGWRAVPRDHRRPALPGEIGHWFPDPDHLQHRGADRGRRRA